MEVFKLAQQVDEHHQRRHDQQHRPHASEHIAQQITLEPVHDGFPGRRKRIGKRRIRPFW
jgi:hypothetical protein